MNRHFKANLKLLLPLFVLLAVLGLGVYFYLRSYPESQFRFGNIHYLWTLLLPLLLLALQIFWHRFFSLSFPITLTAKIFLKRQRSQYAYFIPDALLYACLFLISFTLAGPQLGNQYEHIESDGLDIMLAVDVSRSMEALDFELNEETVIRLDVVKKVVSDFLDKRKYDRFGIIAFGAFAFTQSPLTFDKGVLKTYVMQLQTRIAGSGTAIGDGLALAVKRVKDIESKSKVVILISDGENNEGQINPQEAAEAAKKLGVKVYTIGIGTTGRVPMRYRGRIVRQHLALDEDLLKLIAATTGGKYYYAGDTASLEKIYAEIDLLEKTKVQSHIIQEYRHLYSMVIITIFILFILRQLVLLFWIKRIDL